MLVKYTVSEFLSAKGSFSSIDIYVCERSEQEKIRLFKNEKNNNKKKTVAAAKIHINKKNYSLQYHVILGRFKWLINGFTEFMIEQ